MPDDEIKERCEKQGIKTLYLEANTVSVSRMEALKKVLPSVEISSSDKFDNFIEQLRSIKTAGELELKILEIMKK
jgi:Xaa-Pro aminopeptidase